MYKIWIYFEQKLYKNRSSLEYIERKLPLSVVENINMDRFIALSSDRSLNIEWWVSNSSIQTSPKIGIAVLERWDWTIPAKQDTPSLPSTKCKSHLLPRFLLLTKAIILLWTKIIKSCKASISGGACNLGDRCAPCLHSCAIDFYTEESILMSSLGPRLPGLQLNTPAGGAGACSWTPSSLMSGARRSLRQKAWCLNKGEEEWGGNPEQVPNSRDPQFICPTPSALLNTKQI